MKNQIRNIYSFTDILVSSSFPFLKSGPLKYVSQYLAHLHIDIVSLPNAYHQVLTFSSIAFSDSCSLVNDEANIAFL